METAGIPPPVKTPQLNSPKATILPKVSENENPNHKKHSPISKSASKSRKSCSKNVNPCGKNRMRERKFVVAKKNKRSDGLNQSKEEVLGCKCSKGNGKCLCVAYQSLRASQEDFFKNRSENEGVLGNGGTGKGWGEYGNGEEGGNGKRWGDKVGEYGNVDEIGEMGVSAIKRCRDKLLEEARECVPEPGSGRVMHLVKAFERMKMVSILKSNESGNNDEKEGEDKCLKWALPGMQVSAEAPGTQLSSSSLCPSNLFLTSECLGLDSRRSSSLDSYGGRNSSDSSLAFVRRQWRKKQKLKTTAKPFKLRTEERGKCKEEEFMKKVKQMMEEEEKLRVRIAQGLPWTTDEPECLAKPPVKEATKPIDLVLHSDVRAEERAEFDHQVAEKMSITEQYRMEKDRQQKLAEEEEIRRLRKELVIKAQPMPYFDRPFVPRRSEKQPTIPKEPKFHIPQHKKIKCTQQYWSDTSSSCISSDACYDGL